MKILIATGLYTPDIGGPATYTAFLERHLSSHGFKLTVVPFTKVRTLPRYIRHIFYTYRLIKEGRDADILYALDPVSVGIPTLVAGIILRKHFCLRVPGDYAWEQGQNRYGMTSTLDEYLEMERKPFRVRLFAFLQYVVARRARAVIVPSRYMKKVVMRWGISEEKIFVIHSAVHPTIVHTSRDALRTRFHYEGFVVLTAARLVPWKGIPVLIDAIVELRRKGILVSLDIVGDGRLFDELYAQIEKLHATDYIYLRGRESKNTLSERIKASDVFVLNTSYEGLSHQLLEVMDIGIPIVTTPVGGNPEIIEDEKTGLLVPFNDKDALIGALERLRIDTGLRIRLVEEARDQVSCFSEENIVHDIIQFFTDTWSLLAKVR